MTLAFFENNGALTSYNDVINTFRVRLSIPSLLLIVLLEYLTAGTSTMQSPLTASRYSTMLSRVSGSVDSIKMRGSGDVRAFEGGSAAATAAAHDKKQYEG